MAVQKILVVDDDAELRKMMAHFLRIMGFLIQFHGAEIENFINRAMIILFGCMRGKKVRIMP
ncbi:MAG: hypothetical protein CM15mP117_12840 [Alphaproteobacteria bacterium]|nr:MAG: hypothetical protein CM15mP117_12840 [Alphaproteobacteria bacterium]